MPARKKNDQAALPGMPSMADLRDTLWKAADKLRGSMDAAQYKDFVLGLVFLKYVSDSFEERREQIRADVLADGVPESRIERRSSTTWTSTSARACSGCPRTPAGTGWPSRPRARASASSSTTRWTRS